ADHQGWKSISALLAGRWRDEALRLHSGCVDSDSQEAKAAKNAAGYEASAKDSGFDPRPASAIQILCESFPCRFTAECRRPALRHPFRVRVLRRPRLAP